MNGKTIRINRVIDPNLKRSLIVDASSLLEGRYDEKSFQIFKEYCDGIVLVSSQVERLYYVFLGRRAPALILKLGWKNVSHDLIPQVIEDALFMGASAVMSPFLVGHERDEDEAKNLEIISLIARQGERLNLPFIVECVPYGERVTKENFSKCVELAARVAAEAGADIIAIPYVREQALLKKIINGVSIPVLMSDIMTPFGSAIENAEIALNGGASGFLIGEETFQGRHPIKVIKRLYDLITGGF